MWLKFLLPILFFSSFLTCARVPAFPGAEGGGMFVTGGRGGKILFVDNLNDKGDGSLRKAIEAEGPRTVIFRVSGNIKLQKTLHLKNNDITIAGQTAPGDGICLLNYGLRVDADNVIIRFIRIRPGDLMQVENDAINGSRNKNIIIDHCSFSWGNDEVVSLYDNENFTLQWCIISESLYKSAHHKGNHGYGGIWGGLNASFHHNLLSDHTSRNPRFGGSRYHGIPENEKTDFRNNVIYNWGFNTIYGGEGGNYNIVNNYFKPGPATSDKTKKRIVQLTQAYYDPKYTKDTLGAGMFYVEGNVFFNNPKVSMNNWQEGVYVDKKHSSAKDKSKLTEPILFAPVLTHSAEEAFKLVLKYAGASLNRDAIDKRIVNEVETGREQFGKSFEDGGNGIIDSQNDVGGWPELQSHITPQDTDNDGMPDHWEKAHKLNPNYSADALAFTLHQHYTNIEVYMNSLVSGSFNQ